MAEENSNNTDENISEELRLLRNWLGDIVAEQRKTVASLNRIRNHLVFYTVMIILGIILWAIANGFLPLTTMYSIP